METCVCCGQETAQTAAVYREAPGAPPVRQTEYLCASCIKKQNSSLYPVIFYLTLQLCWFTVLKNGLLTPFGLLAACIALAGLWRLGSLIVPRLSKGSGGRRSEEEASEALKQVLVKREGGADGHVLSLREYRRKYGQGRP